MTLAQIKGRKNELVKGMKWKVMDSYECIHNYMDASEETITTFGSPMLRKGAISAKADEKVIIPINMRDGILLGTGLGNTDWNWSAPPWFRKNHETGGGQKQLHPLLFQSRNEGHLFQLYQQGHPG